EPEAMGEGAHEEGHRRDPRREEASLHRAIQLLAGGRSPLHGLWRTGPARLHSNCQASADHVAGRKSNPPYRHGRSPLREPETLLLPLIPPPIPTQHPPSP